MFSHDTIETGDIIIFDGTPGHVGMIYAARDMTSRPFKAAQCIHAQKKGNFHIDPVVEEKSGGIYYLLENTTIYKPAWKSRADKADKQAQLRRVADGIKAHATYGVYRAVRLFIGDSTYGPKAKERRAKYLKRMNNGFRDPDGGDEKFVSTITCSESVILCFQLTFDESDPLFIKLDAAHTMPKTLESWLKGAGWTSGRYR